MTYAEIHVKRFMSRHRRLIGLSEEDDSVLERMAEVIETTELGLPIPKAFAMTVTEIFRFRDGRIVLVGEVNGHAGYIPRIRFEIRQGGELCGLLDMEGEMIASRSEPGRTPRLRSVSSTSVSSSLRREFLDRGPLILRSRDVDGDGGSQRSIRLQKGRKSQMHRHLPGIDSPPPDYLADPMTQGPVLPEGWDGDAWEGSGGYGSFLRAWHKPSGRVAYGKGLFYEEARSLLLDDLRVGGQRVEFQTLESALGRG